MAEKMAPEQRDGETGELLNSANRQECLQKAFKEVAELERQKEALVEQYIKPIRDAIKKAKQNMKGDTDIEIADFNLMFKLYKRQEDAKMMEEDDRARVMDNMREAFSALHEGDMLDFVDVLDAA